MPHVGGDEPDRARLDAILAARMPHVGGDEPVVRIGGVDLEIVCPT